MKNKLTSQYEGSLIKFTVKVCQQEYLPCVANTLNIIIAKNWTGCFVWGNVKIFLCLVEDLQKYSHLTHRITTFPWDKNIFLVKRPNYPYYHPLPPTVGYSPLPLEHRQPSSDHLHPPPDHFRWLLRQVYFWKCTKYS